MPKLKLSLDALQVDSFHATAEQSARGTVPGHSWTQYADESCFQSCNGGCTGWASCHGGCGSGNTCYASCNGTCNCTVGCTDPTGCGCETWETCPGATVCA